MDQSQSSLYCMCRIGSTVFCVQRLSSAGHQRTKSLYGRSPRSTGGSSTRCSIWPTWKWVWQRQRRSERLEKYLMPQRGMASKIKHQASGTAWILCLRRTPRRPRSRWSIPVLLSPRPSTRTSTPPTTSDNEAKPVHCRQREAEAAATPAKKKVLVFSSGPIRMGQGIEFDYCSGPLGLDPEAAHRLEAILVNNNPRRSPTDLTPATACYFDPLNPRAWTTSSPPKSPNSLVAQFGGQDPPSSYRPSTWTRSACRSWARPPMPYNEKPRTVERFDELLERCSIPRAGPAPSLPNLDEALACRRRDRPARPDASLLRCWAVRT